MKIRIFQYSFADATELIKERRSNLARKRVSDGLWNLVRAEKEAQGYDREAYEHEIETGGKKTIKYASTIPPPNNSQARSMYIVKLDGLLDTAKKIQVAGALPQLPPTVK